MKDNYSIEYQKQYEDNEFEKVLVSIRRKNILGSLNNYPHNSILEIGCGLEPLYKFVNDFSEFTIVEPIDDFVENAKRLTEGDQRITIIKGKIEESYQLIESGKYDFIVISSLLHEVFSPESILQAIHKLCNKGTIVYIDVPNKNSFHKLIGVAMGIIHSVDDKSEMDKRFNHWHHFDIESLRQLVINQLFKIERQWTFFIKPFSHSQMAKMLKANIIDTTVLEGLQEMVRYLPDHGSSIAMELKIM